MKLNFDNKFLKNSFYMYLLTFAKIIMPFITLPYLTRVLSVETYGVVVYVKSILRYVQLVIDFGFLLSVTKEIVLAKKANNWKLISHIISTTLVTRVFLGLVSLIIFVFLINVVPILTKYSLFSILSLLIGVPVQAKEIDTNMAQMQAEYEAYISELAQANLSAAEEFLSENAEADGVIATESGLQYEIVSEGDGAQPDADDTVTVTYTLRDINGNLLDQGENFDFALANLIPGFSETVSNMRVGGEAIAYVHPSLGYGESGAGSVEPNSLLIFDIQLHGIVE